MLCPTELRARWFPEQQPDHETPFARFFNIVFAGETGRVHSVFLRLPLSPENGSVAAAILAAVVDGLPPLGKNRAAKSFTRPAPQTMRQRFECAGMGGATTLWLRAERPSGGGGAAWGRPLICCSVASRARK